VTRERIYWLLIAAFAVGLIVLYVIYVYPVQKRVREQRATLADLQQRLAKPAKFRKEVPSRKGLDGREAYRAWLDLEMNDKVAPFFARSDATLDRPLVSDPTRLTPPRFKDGYLRRVAEIRAELNRRVPGIVLGKELFADHEWAETGALPDPADYAAIRQDINIRAQVLDFVAAHKGRQVKKLTVGGAGPWDRSWRLIPLSFEIVLPAEEVAAFVRSLLNVTWSRGGNRTLCMLPRRIHVARLDNPVGGPGAVGVEMELDVVDFDDSLREGLSAEPKT